MKSPHLRPHTFNVNHGEKISGCSWIRRDDRDDRNSGLSGLSAERKRRDENMPNTTVRPCTSTEHRSNVEGDALNHARTHTQMVIMCSSADLRDHARQQSIRGDVEGHAEPQVTGALVPDRVNFGVSS
jgi:hypothetical protein